MAKTSKKRDDFHDFLRYEVGLNPQQAQQTLSKAGSAVRLSPKRRRDALLKLKRFGLREIQRVIRRAPRFLGYKTDKKLHALHEYLITVGCKQPLKCIERHPELLTYNLQALVKPNIARLKALGIRNIEGLFKNYPNIIPLASEERIQNIVSRLAKLGVNAPAKVIAMQPNILAVSAERWENHLQYLVSIGIVRPDRIVSKYPGIMLNDIERSIAPKVAFISTIVGKTRLIKVLEAHPRLLAYSLESKLQSSVKHLYALGFVSLPDIIQVVPSLLVRDHSKHTAPLMKLLKEELCIDPIRIIEKYPMITGYSVGKKTALTASILRFCAKDNTDQNIEWLFIRMLRANVSILKHLQLLIPNATGNQLLATYDSLNREEKDRSGKTIAARYKEDDKGFLKRLQAKAIQTRSGVNYRAQPDGYGHHAQGYHT